MEMSLMLTGSVCDHLCFCIVTLVMEEKSRVIVFRWVFIEAKKHFKMINSVEDDEFDVQSGLKNGWAITFCVLYIIVMIISIILYFITIRAVALEIRAHNTTYLLVMLLFFAAIIEFGVIVGGKIIEFMFK